MPELTPQQRFKPAPGSLLTRAVVAELSDEVKRFEGGESVIPRPRVLGHFSLLPHERALLASPMGFPYTCTFAAENGRTILNMPPAEAAEPLRSLLSSLHQSFYFAVGQQVKALGVKRITSWFARAGDYNGAGRQDAGWHPDDGVGILRLVASFGTASPTQFADGPIALQDFSRKPPSEQRFFTWDDKRWRIRTYGTAALTLFVSGHYAHRASPNAGTRAFYSASLNGAQRT